MSIQRSIVMFVLLFLSGCLYAQKTDLLVTADASWLNRHSPENAKQSMLLYRKALMADTNSYEALWKYGRSCFFYANYFVSEKDNEKKKQVFGTGKDYCLKATALNPEGVEAHYWLATLYGQWAEANGVLKSLAYVNPIKNELDKVIKLDPAFDHAGGYRILGRVYYRAPGWPVSIGDGKLSVLNLKKALDSAPGNRLNYYFLADTLSGQNEKAEAMKLILKALALPQDTANVTEDNDTILNLKDLKKEIEKK
jgi:tetratricopeptide (TPR) repeat protein